MTDTRPTLLDTFKSLADELHRIVGKPNKFTLILEADRDSIDKVAAWLGYLKGAISPWRTPEAKIYEAYCFGMSILLRVKE